MPHPSITRRTLRLRRGLLAALAVTMVMAVAACGSDDQDDQSEKAPTNTIAATPKGKGPPGAGAASATAALKERRTVIDVRTPEEFAQGAVKGATRIGLADSDFVQQIRELDPKGRYVLYCRSGNRSAQAAELMRASGIDVVDGGGLQTMADAGWSTTSG